MTSIKKFFGITENNYTFEWCDFTTFITILNVMFVLIGKWWAPFFGLLNCFVGLALNVKYKAHINTYMMQIALIVLNIYFLQL